MPAVDDVLLDPEAFLALPLILPLALPLFTGVVTAWLPLTAVVWLPFRVTPSHWEALRCIEAVRLHEHYHEHVPYGCFLGLWLTG